MSSFSSAITVPAEGLSSQPGGPDPSSSAAPRITTAGHNVKYPLGWAASEAQNFKPVLSHPRRQYKYEKLKTCTLARQAEGMEAGDSGLISYLGVGDWETAVGA